MNTLNGGGGNDTLYGNGGNDVLNGGAGKDVFTFTVTSDSTLDNLGRITDFQHGSDTINLSGTGIDRAHLSYDYDNASHIGTLSDSDSSFTVELAGVHELNFDDDVIC